jgi:ATP-independent RNA helicase DbpA
MTFENSSAAELHPVLKSFGFNQATLIQREAMPALMRGESVLALSPTGSGKTLAFLVPLMERLEPALAETQLLVLAPTRELGAQIAQVATQVAQFLVRDGEKQLAVRSVFGGQKAETQKLEILKNPAVVVATPGRALELIEQDILNISGLKAIVLDEADLMVGMGFEAQVKSICDHLPSRVQAALFSATESEGQSRLQNRLVHRGTRIDVRAKSSSDQRISTEVPNSLSRHETFLVPQGKERIEALGELLAHIGSEVQSGIVFCETRESVQRVSENLQTLGQSVAGLSGELGQIERASILRHFRSGGIKFLVATNLAARGIDISELSVVVHFELPSTQQEYLHRSGRTGRAGKSGWTISMCTAQSRKFLTELLSGTGIQLEACQLEPKNVSTTAVAHEFAKIHINRGKSSKLRPGDILGALTQQLGLGREDVGGIFIFDHFSHIEVARPKAQSVLNRLSGCKIKNMNVKASEAEVLSAPRSRSF